MKIVKQDKYEVGDGVRITDDIHAITDRFISDSTASKWAGKIMTISLVGNHDWYEMAEDERGWSWHKSLIAGKVVVYREVARPAKVGEWVKLINKQWSHTTVGEIVPVSRVYETGVTLVKNSQHKIKNADASDDYEWCYFPKDYVVLEGYEPPKPSKQYTEIRCKECGQVVAYDEVIPVKKHEYTAEQIREAKQYVMEKMYSLTKKKQYLLFETDECRTEWADLYQSSVEPYSFLFKHAEHKTLKIGGAKAYCSENDVWNADIVKFVATKKLFQEDLPEWVRP